MSPTVHHLTDVTNVPRGNKLLREESSPTCATTPTPPPLLSVAVSLFFCLCLVWFIKTRKRTLTCTFELHFFLFFQSDVLLLLTVSADMSKLRKVSGVTCGTKTETRDPLGYQTLYKGTNINSIDSYQRQNVYTRVCVYDIYYMTSFYSLRRLKINPTFIYLLMPKNLEVHQVR